MKLMGFNNAFEAVDYIKGHRLDFASAKAENVHVPEDPNSDDDGFVLVIGFPGRRWLCENGQILTPEER